MVRRLSWRRPAASGPAPGVYPIDSGTAEIIADRSAPGRLMLMVNGVESSHVDLDDPSYLEFEYLRWMSLFIRHHLRGTPGYQAVHLGAAGCSLAGQLIALQPESRHLAVEIDARLAALVREWFSLPRAPLLRIRVGDARAVTESLDADSRDVVIRDVFAGAVTPFPLTTVEFTQHVRRVLRPGGLYLLNCADSPDLALARHEIATVGSVFPYVAAAADPPMLRGRRRGNLIIAGSDVPISTPGLARDLLADPAGAGFWGNDQARTFAAGYAVLRDRAPS